MKKICHLFVLLLLLNIPAYPQAILQIGEPFIPDAGYDLMLAQDGGFITCGYRGNNAVLYKSDCAGNLVAQIEKQYAPGPGRFFDAIELPDGSIVAVGSATIATPADTLERVLLLKTTSDLTEIAVSNFLVVNNYARAKSVTLASNGDLMVLGEMKNIGSNFTITFIQRVHPNTLQIIGTPSLFATGAYFLEEIIRTADGNYLMVGSGFSGNILDPNAMIINRLIATKIKESGNTFPILWTYTYLDAFPAQYGLAFFGGVEQNPVTGNFMLAGTTYSGSPDMHQDAIFILLDNNGNLLDTALLQAPMRQGIYGMTAYQEVPGLFLAVGDSDNPVFGTPNLFAAQAYELNGQIFQTSLINEIASPISFSDVIEIGQNRLAALGTLPDNPTLLSFKDIIVATPEIGEVEILYQNCALVASFSATNPTYQWYLDDMPLPGATAGVYFPTQSGVYQVQITDDIGCSGFSDTMTVALITAGFDVATDNLTATFTNTSTLATSWNWNFGDGQTSTSENPEHEYAAGGVYTVTLIASSPCGADTISQTVGLVGADEPSWLRHFRLFPNPNAGIFSVEITGMPQAELAFALLDATGKVLSRQIVDFQTGKLAHQFDFGDLLPGIYTLQMHAQNGIKFVKVIVTE